MRAVRGVSVAALFLGLMATEAWAQAPASVQTFYLSGQPADLGEVLAVLRNSLDTDAKVNAVGSQNAIVVRGSAEQLAAAQKLITELNRPRKNFRLTYTITEVEDGKRIGVQHSSIILVSGQKTTLKNGSKVPVETGSHNVASASQAQMTYLDVGLNIDATVEESPEGVRLQTKVKRSGVAEEKSMVGPRDPVIRQAVVWGASLLTPGKSLTLGSFDFPGTMRRMDVEVMAEAVK